MQRISVRVLVVLAGLSVAIGCTQTGNPPESSSSSSGSSVVSSSSSTSQPGSSGVSTSASQSASSTSSSGALSSSAGGSSSGGESSSGTETCNDECAADSRVCDGTDAFRVCGNFDSDTCLELSPSISCPTDYLCDLGDCAPPCSDECPTGTSACRDTGTVVTCGNYDADACRELGAPQACDVNNHCESGVCVADSAGCSDECTAGTTVCFGDSTRACGTFDADSCLDLGAPELCEVGQTCTDGVCGSPCSNDCGALGDKECSGGGTRTCGNYDADSCLDWSTVTLCAPLICDQGECVTTCSNECTTDGETVCSTDNTGVRTCGNFDGDNCLDLSSSVPCGGTSMCNNGICAPTCSDDCSIGDTRCTVDSAGVESCGNYDGDACREFGGATPCGGTSTCSNNACDTPCNDDCAVGAAECITGENGFRTCGQYDADACRDWSSTTPCAPYEVCEINACVLGPTPATILVNEILYDAASVDTNPGNTLFVELWGPAGTSLDGYELVGVDGNGGTVYNSISLTGEVVASDGYFLIAHPAGDAALVAQADITSSSVDFQNGPDNVQLRWRGRVVDAIGYGIFTTATFAGEGTAAPSSGSAKSLTRSATHADTNVNSADFTIAPTPSPRANPTTCTDDCTAGQTQCQGTLIQDCGNFDADSCLDWGTAAGCPTSGQECVNNVCTTPCSNDCSAGQTRCQGIQIQGCGDFDADSCRDWGTAGDCPNAGEQCSNDVCSIPCNNDCPTSGATACEGSQVKTCGNHDADSCLEYSAPQACPPNQTCSGGSCQPANAPEVRLISPQGTLQTTQGTSHRMLVDATPAPGRSITEIRYLANGVQLHATTSAPHEYTYEVPASASTGSTITLQATAVDDVGVIGSSPFAYLDVRNDVPLATFNASISGANVVTVDASAVSDTETPASALEVRWDWENDGTWDTTYSTTKVATFTYATSASYTIKMEVRDGVQQTASALRTVTFQDVQFIGGTTLTSQTWYGTIVVTGDITVPSTETLTISEGTQVLFVNADTDSNGIGDYTLLIDGILLVEGSAANPVVFTGQNSTAKVRGGWDRIILAGAGSILSNAIIEYADVGIEARAAVTMNNVTVRLTRWDGIELENADNSTLTDVTTTQTGQSGLYVHSGSTGVTAMRLTSTQNAANGIWVDGGSAVTLTDSTISGNSHRGVGNDSATLNVSGSTIELNTLCGLCYYGTAAGTAQRNQVMRNGQAGVQLESTASGHPNPVVNLNNVYSNSTVGGPRIGAANASVSIATSGSQSGTFDSSVYTAPSGKTIRRVQVTYSETSTTTSLTGYLVNVTNGQTTTYSSPVSNQWVYLPPGTTQVRTRITDQTTLSSYNCAMSAGAVDLVSEDGSVDVAMITFSGTPNLRNNYLGTFPSVLSRATLARAAAADLEGFVGQPFDSTFSTGPYKAGSLTADTWGGTIYVTGSITIPAGETITVNPATQILFIDHDQDNDGDGDFSITAGGVLNLAGTSTQQVRVTGYGVPEGNVFKSIELNGSGTNTSNWTHVVADHGRAPLVIRGTSSISNLQLAAGTGTGIYLTGGGGSSLTDVTISGAGGDGVLLDNSDNITLTRVTTTDNALQGLSLANGSTGATVSRLTSRANGQAGVHIIGGSTVTIEDSTIRENTSHGVLIRDSSPALSYNNIVYNGGSGVYIEGSGSPDLARNIVKFNDDCGVQVWTLGDLHPAPTVQYSNIYGNAVVGSTNATTLDPGISIATSGSESGTFDSSVYTAPAGATIRRVRVTYSETSTTTSLTGYVVNVTTGETFTFATPTANAWVYLRPGTTAVRVRITDQTTLSSYNCSMTANAVQLVSQSTADHYELVANTDSGLTNAKFNYWTADVGTVPTKISESRAGAVDYTGYTGFEYPSTGANAVGPRP